MDHRELWRADAGLVVRLRRERGWSRARLALAAGVSHHTVSKVERGQPVFPTTLSHLAAALGVTAAELRSCGEVAPTVPRSRRGLLDAVRDRYGLFQASLTGEGFGLLEREFPKGLARGVRWTYAATTDFTVAGAYLGTDGVLRFFERLFADYRLAEHRVEQTAFVGRREVFVRGFEIASAPGAGQIKNAWMHHHTFDRRGRLIGCHTSVDVLSIEPAGVEGGA